MKSTRAAANALDGAFLETRGKILEVAANLDRVAQTSEPSAVSSDRRMTQLAAALAILTDNQPEKAKRCQMAFSLPYDATWHDRFQRS